MIESGDGNVGNTSTTTNRYRERAGLTVVPRVEDVLARDGVKLFHVMVVTLLERGGPMTCEEIAGRLTDAGATVLLAPGPRSESFRPTDSGPSLLPAGSRMNYRSAGMVLSLKKA